MISSRENFGHFCWRLFRTTFRSKRNAPVVLSEGALPNFVSLDINDAEDRYLAEQIEYVTPDKHFDAQWAMTLLRMAMTRLQEEYIKRGKASAFDALKGFVNEDESEDSPSYEQVAKLLGVQVGSAKTLVHRFRKRYSAFVRQEIACTVSHPGEVDEELHWLCEALIVSGGAVEDELPRFG